MQGLYKFIRASQILCSLDMNRSEQLRDKRQQDQKTENAQFWKATYCQALFYHYSHHSFGDGDRKQQEAAAFSSPRLPLDDRSWAAHLPGLKASSCGMQNIAGIVISLCNLFSASDLRVFHSRDTSLKLCCQKILQGEHKASGLQCYCKTEKEKEKKGKERNILP